MTVAGILIGNIKGGIPLWATRLEQGLASAAIGLVALAAYKMSTTLATDKLTRILALVAGSISALYSAPWLLPVMMIAGGLVSYTFDTFLQPLYIKTTERQKNKSSENETLEAKKEDQNSRTVQEVDLEQGHADVTPESENVNVEESKGKDDIDSASLRNRARTNTTVVDINSDTNPVKDEKVGRILRERERGRERVPSLLFMI